ncbi:EcsC family protein [Nonlabens dokdonensis]|uniref:EcsC family protein n=1 Tax=Nonlabens dokdonensis TaxID=328515 RepID=A0A1Z8ARA0_9FLAO|nr:EcsC family protein [Nonlabens dokdonensis]OUS12880.1 EcsC family protein [Nonlabens dokdonensis]
MAEEINKGVIMKTLDWTYDKAVSGFPGIDSAYEMAENYLKNQPDKIKAADSLIRWQNTKSGTSGFLAGLGGFITLPVTIPANLASIMYIQIRMIAAIAVIGGYDLKDDRVKSLIYACMTGNAAKEIIKDVGLAAGKKFAIVGIKNISTKTIIAINQKVGFRLITKFGEKGVVNLGKAIPIAGGVIGGAIDSYTTNVIGNIARNTFVGKKVKYYPYVTIFGYDITY